MYLNHAPVANAGPDVSTDVGFDLLEHPALMILISTGSPSHGPGLRGLGGDTDADTMNQAFFTPTTAGVYVFMITVSDGISSTVR